MTFYTAFVEFTARNTAGDLVEHSVAQDVTDCVNEARAVGQSDEESFEAFADRLYYKQVEGFPGFVEVTNGGVRAESDDQVAQVEAAAATVRQPIVVAYGVGVDSTAMLVGMHQRGIRPDLILFADTAAEKPETYAYLPIIGAWLEKVGFPPITTVRYVPTRAPYDTLEGKCHSNETLPSLAFGGHSCSIVFKAGPQDKFVKTWQPAVDAWSNGVRVLKAIGYDNSAQDCKRRANADKAVGKKADAGNLDALRYEYWYPLQEWKITRAECEALIESEGLPVPMKSSCFFCPASKQHEIVWLRDTHPALFDRAVAMEERARNGKHGLGSTVGLGRRFAWSDFAKHDQVVAAEAPAEAADAIEADAPALAPVDLVEAAAAPAEAAIAVVPAAQLVTIRAPLFMGDRGGLIQGDRAGCGGVLQGRPTELVSPRTVEGQRIYLLRSRKSRFSHTKLPRAVIHSDSYHISQRGAWNMQQHDIGHVEGPWSLSGEAKYHGLRFIRITDATGGSVAYVFSGSEAELTPQQRATAHLIASAPELAAALPFFSRIARDRGLLDRMLEALPERERTLGLIAFNMARDAYAKASDQAVEALVGR